MMALPKRSERALEERSPVIDLGDDLYLVRSSDGDQWYTVWLGEGRADCECPDATYRRVICKHARRAVIAKARGQTI